VIGDVVDNENILKFFSLAPQEVPALVIHDTDGKPDRRWVYANATVEGMEPWIQDVLDGKVERTPKSALPPDPKNNTGPVTIVVGTSARSPSERCLQTLNPKPQERFHWGCPRNPKQSLKPNFQLSRGRSFQNPKFLNPKPKP